jgi:hypothetical protein
LSPLRKNVRKPSRITFAVAATTVAATAVVAGVAVGPASPVARVSPVSARQTAGHHRAKPISYVVPDRQLQLVRADAVLEHVQHIAAKARIAAEHAAARRAAQERAAATAAANAAAAKAAAAKKAAPAAVQPSGNPQQIALSMLSSFGWSSSQFSCLVSLWNRESGWNTYASNPSSGAYGIPQALPGSKMASAGADWATNPATQIKWGLGYIQSVYGSPCAAWDHSESVGWY